MYIIDNSDIFRQSLQLILSYILIIIHLLSKSLHQITWETISVFTLSFMGIAELYLASSFNFIVAEHLIPRHTAPQLMQYHLGTMT